ncbi:hypothetical protein BaRGS_00017030 [Batillaria attramentaria]|uniref:G-protein coupled receptors family 1 profile domain-containing protein n=1 Tax=Batillaria attramentaria TaxID=370345 RepID=A0ABD0KWZ9_9CAEN
MPELNTVPVLVDSTRNVDSETNDTEASNFRVPDGCVVLRLTVSDFVPWDNPENLISQEVERAFDTVTVVFLYILFLISAPTNIISMIAFYKQGIKERINFCMFCQSFADLSYMVFNFVFYSDRLYLEIAKGERRGMMSLFVLDNYLVGLYGFIWWSSFLTMVIACERCFCVVFPFGAQRVLKTRTMAVIILTAFVVIMAGFFVVGSRWGISCVFDPTQNTTSLMTYPREFYLQNRHIIDVLDGLVYGLILPATFDLIVIVTTVITLVKLKRMTSWRESTSSVYRDAGDCSDANADWSFCVVHFL